MIQRVRLAERVLLSMIAEDGVDSDDFCCFDA